MAAGSRVVLLFSAVCYIGAMLSSRALRVSGQAEPTHESETMRTLPVRDKPVSSTKNHAKTEPEPVECL